MTTSPTAPTLPLLRDGVVRFCCVADFIGSYDATLAKGALSVHSDDALEPLTPFQVTFEIEGMRTNNAANVQVVSFRNGILLMQILDGSADACRELEIIFQQLQAQQAALVAAVEINDKPDPGCDTHELAAEPIPSGGVSRDQAPPISETPVTEAPVPQATPNSTAHPQQPLAVTLSTSPATAVPEPVPSSEPVPTAPSAPPQAVPATPLPVTAPEIHNNTLMFANVPSLLAALDEIEKSSGLMTHCSGATPAFGPVSLLTGLPTSTGWFQLEADVVFAQGDQVALLFADKQAVQQSLRTLLQAPAQTRAAEQDGTSTAPGGDPTPAQKRSSHASALVLERRALHNPGSPPALLHVNLAQPPDPRRAPQASLAEIVASIGRLRLTGTLHVESDSHKIEIPIKAGAMLLSNDEREQLVQLSIAQQGYCSVDKTLPDRIASDKRPRDPRGIATEMARRMLREHRGEDLEAGLAAYQQRFPIAKPKVSPAMYGLKLDTKEARFLDLVIDGTRSLAEIPRVAGLLKPATFRCYYLLMMYQLIEHLDDAKPDPSADPVKTFRAECRRLLAANPFDVLGVHWSEHPDLIRERYQKRKQRFAASSPLAKLDPESAAQVRQKIEQAQETLSKRSGRKEARAALGSLDVKAAAHILSKHAELASIRQEFTTVRECLEMALELHPVREYQTMMQILLKKSGS